MFFPSALRRSVRFAVGSFAVAAWIAVGFSACWGLAEGEVVRVQSERHSKKESERTYLQHLQIIEDFLNHIRSWRADFIEIGRAGDVSRGVFILKKSPAMMKMDYINPPLRVVTVKKQKVTYYDKELKEKSVTSVYSSPLSFFLDFKIDLKENVSIIDCKESDGRIEATFKKKDDKDGEKGVVRIAFRILSDEESGDRSNGKNKEKAQQKRRSKASPTLQMESWEIYRNVRALNLENPVRVFLKNQVINQYISDEEF